MVSMRYLILIVAIVATPVAASADWDWRPVLDEGISPSRPPRPVWQRHDDRGMSPSSRKAPTWVHFDAGMAGPKVALAKHREPLVAPQWMKDLAKER